MNLLSPDRPRLGPDVPTILLDGSAIPFVSVWPVSETAVQLTVLLHDYSPHHSFSYTQHQITVPHSDLGDFFATYFRDPEATLRDYFGWVPQAPTGKLLAVARPRVPPRAPSTDFNDAFDLL